MLSSFRYKLCIFSILFLSSLLLTDTSGRSVPEKEQPPDWRNELTSTQVRHSQRPSRQAQPPVFEFTRNLTDQTACPGQQAVFQCEYTGTKELPRIDINGTVYSATNPPYGFSYTSEGLIVEPVYEGQDGLRITFLYIVYRDGSLHHIRSDTATLHVAFPGFGTSPSDTVCSASNVRAGFLVDRFGC